MKASGIGTECLCKLNFEKRLIYRTSAT